MSVQNLPKEKGRAFLRMFEHASTPWYLIDRVRRTIRVFHGDLDETYWKRGGSPGESRVRRVEMVILSATGLRRIKRRHDRQVVEFVLREEIFDRAAVALRMSFKCVAEDDASLRQILGSSPKKTPTLA